MRIVIIDYFQFLWMLVVEFKGNCIVSRAVRVFGRYGSCCVKYGFYFTDVQCEGRSVVSWLTLPMIHKYLLILILVRMESRVYFIRSETGETYVYDV